MIIAFVEPLNYSTVHKLSMFLVCGHAFTCSAIRFQSCWKYTEYEKVEHNVLGFVFFCRMEYVMDWKKWSDNYPQVNFPSRWAINKLIEVPKWRQSDGPKNHLFRQENHVKSIFSHSLLFVPIWRNAHSPINRNSPHIVIEIEFII